MTDLILWLILLGVAVTLVLSLVQLRGSMRAHRDAARELREELRIHREEARSGAKELRDEVAGGVRSSSETLSKLLTTQQGQMEVVTKRLQELSESNRMALDRIRETFDVRVRQLQESNEKKLEEMRKTVDEKLHDTLEKRLGESFKLVSERLEAVHKGLGEMQNLATGVGDLKRVLTNVKTRGTWGEVQLGSILEEILPPQQWERNVQIRKSSLERVEFAVRLPGRDPTDPDAVIWLPIDSKFPQEDYQRLQAAAEAGDPDAVDAAAASLLRSVRASAREIRDKYVDPPATMDFAILFLPTEGLYAEVLRQPGFTMDLQREFRVLVTGPTTLSAILTSLRVGFQALAIEQRSAEVWKVLGAVKTEFGKFGEVLDKVQNQLATASRTIEASKVRTRAMARTLREVESLPAGEASSILALEAGSEEEVLE
jgi:DNA recombination protein RmuC